jgi:hypothetical protein
MDRPGLSALQATGIGVRANTSYLSVAGTRWTDRIRRVHKSGDQKRRPNPWVRLKFCIELKYQIADRPSDFIFNIPKATATRTCVRTRVT